MVFSPGFAERLRTALCALAVLGVLALPIGSPGRAAEPRRVPEALPGAPPFPSELRARLERALAGQGADYQPRTQRRRADGSPRFTNRLLLETSPYLRQHAHNPVDWHPWGDEAFARARALDRPVLVSIGYSTCHWCHVMEDESFDDPEVAAVLNAGFVAVKVDREVRPDVDAIYMTAARALGGGGGWPLNVWLTADREPFYAGTYFPPEARGGRPGFRQVLETLQRRYASERGPLEARARHAREAVRRELESAVAAGSVAPDPGPLDAAFRHYRSLYDDANGGLRRRTKFPSSLPIRLLLRQHRRTGDPEALAMALRTLERMAAGGLRDQLGGSFHRYTVDTRWLVPHFEKMLYDNARLLRAYTEAWQATGRDDLRTVAFGIVEDLERALGAPDGPFYSATDADSPSTSGERVEGWFFTWTPAEIDAQLAPPLARAVRAWFGVTPKGPLEGRSVLHAWRSRAAVARELAIPPDVLDARIAQAIPILRGARSRRPPPLRDEKILVSWNGLLISALAQGGFAFDRPDWIDRATRAADALLARAVRDERLSRLADGDPLRTPGLLEDHAFLIAALLDLHEVTGRARWLAAALRLQAWQDRLFADTEGGGYFRTPADGEPLLAREKPMDDGAVPSGNAVAALNLLRLHALTTDPGWLEQAGMLFAAADGMLTTAPTRASELLLALDFQLEPTREIALIAPSGAPEALRPLVEPLRRRFLPTRVVAWLRPPEAAPGRVPWLADKRALGGRATAYVCIDQVCKYPTSEPTRFSAQIAEPLHRRGGPDGSRR